MHISKFVDECTFSEVAIGGTLPATEEYRQFMKTIHPSKLLSSTLTFTLLEIKYSYILVKNDKTRECENVMYTYGPAGDDYDDYGNEIMIEQQLMEYIADENRKHPFKEVKDVKIISIKKQAYASLKIGYSEEHNEHEQQRRKDKRKRGAYKVA